MATGMSVSEQRKQRAADARALQLLGASTSGTGPATSQALQAYNQGQRAGSVTPTQVLAQGSGPIRTSAMGSGGNYSNPAGDTGFALTGGQSTPTSAPADSPLDANGQTDWSKLIQQGLVSGVDAATMQAYLDGRNAKIAASGGALSQYSDDPISAAAQAYIKSKSAAAEAITPERYDSYQDLYDRGGYADAAAKQQELLAAQLALLENDYSGQRGTISSSAEEQARQAYIAYMQSRNALPQELAAAGFSGGLADSQRLALDLGYQNNQREILQNRDTALNEVETALNNARLQTTAEGIQSQSDLMRDAVAAYQNWVSQNNSFAQQSQLSKQQADQSLSNELALLQAQQQTQKQLESAQSVANAGDYSLLGAYYGWTPEQVAYMNAWHAKQISDPKALESANVLASMGQYDALGSIYGWTPEQVSYAQNYFTTEKALPQNQEYVLALLGAGMMPDSALLAAANIPQSFADAMIQAYQRDQLKQEAADKGAIGDPSGYQQLGWNTDRFTSRWDAETAKARASGKSGSSGNPTTSPSGASPYYDLVLSNAAGMGASDLENYLSGVMITEANPNGLITPEEADVIFRALGGDPDALVNGTSAAVPSAAGTSTPVAGTTGGKVAGGLIKTGRL